MIQSVFLLYSYSKFNMQVIPDYLYAFFTPYSKVCNIVDSYIFVNIPLFLYFSGEMPYAFLKLLIK